MRNYNFEFWGSIASVLGLILAIFLANYKIASIVLFVVSIILLFYFVLIFIKKSLAKIILKALDTHSDLKDLTFKDFSFRKASELSFMNKLDYKDIIAIDIFGHTGENIIKAFLAKTAEIDKSTIQYISIRILLKNPNFESGDRRKGILKSIENIYKAKLKNDLNISLQFYNNLPTFRSIICTTKDDKDMYSSRIAYLSYYHFEPEAFSKKWPFAFEVKEKNGIENPIINKTLSWFNHLWGKEKKQELEIHTILLDFDDTMVNSHGIQISAWIDIIKEVKDNINLNNFSERFRPLINNNRLLEKEISKVFFEKQSADLIYDEIFISLNKEEEGKIKKRRFDLRKSKFEEGNIQLFRDCKEELVKLSKSYNLVIISATDEKMIETYLNEVWVENGENRISFIKYFKYVFGKNEPMIGWSSLKKKSQVILKAISILGVPASRLIYIGDNNGDFLASTTIGIEFIEARLFADELKRLNMDPSLIDSNEKRPIMTTWNSLREDIIMKIEKKKKEEKYK